MPRGRIAIVCRPMVLHSEPMLLPLVQLDAVLDVRRAERRGQGALLLRRAAGIRIGDTEVKRGPDPIRETMRTVRLVSGERSAVERCGGANLDWSVLSLGFDCRVQRCCWISSSVCWIRCRERSNVW